MTYDKNEFLAYWNRPDVESMYDKHLLNAEIDLIRRRIPVNAKILDAGCGEGEGTILYSAIPGVIVHAVDFSETRLSLARQRLASRDNVLLKQKDLLEQCTSENDYDIIVSQRFLINLTEWSLQQNVLLKFMSWLKVGGRLLMMEGSQQGVNSLNRLRSSLGLEPIPVKWHAMTWLRSSLGFRSWSESLAAVARQPIATPARPNRVTPIMPENVVPSVWRSSDPCVRSSPTSPRR
jgi:ubiquinone/menaquinone biosynthesis C-methylase UbiE